MMGGMGRTIDGSYAEYTLVDAANTIPFDTDSAGNRRRASRDVANRLRISDYRTGTEPASSVLIHGGTSTVGLPPSHRPQLGATSSPPPAKQLQADLLHHVGADHVVIDDDTLPDAVRAIAADGLDATFFKFVSAAALPDMLTLTRSGGTVCFVALSACMDHPDFSPFTIPNGVHAQPATREKRETSPLRPSAGTSTPSKPAP